eukprot:4830966-Prymnesium_polylepis.1
MGAALRLWRRQRGGAERARRRPPALERAGRAHRDAAAGRRPGHDDALRDPCHAGGGPACAR